jgi:hypothetical protein
VIQLTWRADELGDLNALLRELGNGKRPFLVEARRHVIEGNTADRLAGRDRHGRPLVPWLVRSGRYRGAGGPTLAPFNQASRSIAAFYGDIHSDRIEFGYRGRRVEILAYHATGRAGTGRKGQTTGIVRDVFGFSPQTRQSLTRMFESHWRSTFRRGVAAVRSTSRRAASFFFGTFS